MNRAARKHKQASGAGFDAARRLRRKVAEGNQHKRARDFASENSTSTSAPKRPKLTSIYPTTSVHVEELNDCELEDLAQSGTKPTQVALHDCVSIDMWTLVARWMGARKLPAGLQRKLLTLVVRGSLCIHCGALLNCS